MLIKTIADLLALSLGVVGQDIFYFNMPDEVKEGLLVIENLDGTPRSEYMPGYFQTYFRVIVRNTDYEDGNAIARQVIAALDLHRVAQGDYHFKRIRATHEPVSFPKPDSDVIEVSCNFWTAYSVDP